MKLISEQNIDEIKSKKIALMDLEGTLTHVKRNVPEDANSEHMRKILEGEKVGGEREIGYWTGLHLLAGEPPQKYVKRWRDWKEGEISTQKFEESNVEIWNKLVEESKFDSPEEFLNWYNKKFLNLRDDSQNLVDLLIEKGFTTGIISHSSTSLSIDAAKELGMDFVVPTWSFNFKQGEFRPTQKKKYADEKSHIIDELKDTGAEKILFFGNGSNDVKVAEEADSGFLISNKERVDYNSVRAVTGSFEDIKAKTEEIN